MHHRGYEWVGKRGEGVRDGAMQGRDLEFGIIWILREEAKRKEATPDHLIIRISPRMISQ